MTNRLLFSLIAAACMLGAASHLARAEGEGLVTFTDTRSQDQKDSGSGANLPFWHLYNKQYGLTDGDTIPDTRVDTRWDAFLSFQASLSELHMDSQSHMSARTGYEEAIRTEPDQRKDANLYFASPWLAPKRPMFDGSGDILASSEELVKPELSMEGKALYFPSEKVIRKIEALTRQAKDDAQRMQDGSEQSIEAFLQAKRELEKEYLQAMAQEISNMAAKYANQETYGIGSVTQPPDSVKSLRLNFAHLKQILKDNGIELPPPEGAGAGPAVPQGPLQTVKQGQAAQKEIGDDYRLFSGGFERESDRTEAEAKHDPFRLRIRPEDLRTDEAGRVRKTYDPYLSHEYVPGVGLNLPTWTDKEQ